MQSVETRNPTNDGGRAVGGIITACATTFVASACVMAVEMLAFRLIARFLGSSQYTTGSIIGVVLGGLAIGNYVGGRLADRRRARPTLAALFILSSIACVLIPPVNMLVGQWSALWEWSWPARCAAHVALTFLVPCGLLGMISPLVAKMALDAGDRVGRTIGGIYAWGVIGSIVGTFATSFYLIPHFGIQAITFAFAGILAIGGVLLAPRRWLGMTGYVWMLLLTLTFALTLSPWASVRAVAADLGLREDEGDDILFDCASEYSQVCVKTVPHSDGKRVMLLDKLAHSYFNPAEPDRLVYGYERVYDAVTEWVAPGRDDLRALVLGGGGYTHPRYFLRRRPKSTIEVVEIDPTVTEAARIAFGLVDDPRLHIVHLDARQHVADLVRRKRAGEAIAPFDVIFLDAVNDFNVPSHLTTLEFQSMVHELLSPDGAYLMNMIDILDVGRMLAAMVETTRRTFAHVECFYANEGELGAGLEGAERNTFVIVGSNRDLHLDRMSGTADLDGARRLLLSHDAVSAVLARVHPSPLSDDHAPVEYLLAPVVERSEQKNVPVRFYNRANRLLDRGRAAGAEENYRRAIELNKPYFDRGLNTSVHFFAHLNLGLLYFNQGRARDAFSLFKTMTTTWPKDPEPWHNLGSVLYSTGSYDDAAKAYQESLSRKPSAAVWHDLGLALGRGGRLTESRDAFDAALKLQPDYPEAREHLEEVAHAISASRPSSRLAE